VGQRRFAAWFVVVCAAVAAVFGFGGSVLANHVATDVPTNSGYHRAVAGVVNAGIATGYADGTSAPASR
jgi:hypothetical protein